MANAAEVQCNLECVAGGNCYLEQQSHGGGGGESDDDGEATTKSQRGRVTRQRCQCPLGRGGDRCQLGERVFLVFFFFII